MTHCEAMRDRMPDVAHGIYRWSADDAAHLVDCRECALEWRLVSAGMALHASTTVPAERIAQVVTARLRTERPAAMPRLRWRGGVIGLMAAAASVILILSLPGHGPARKAFSVDSAVIGVLPELQGLDESDLEKVLRYVGPNAADATPGGLAHLEDLTDGELEQLLHSQGGE